MSTTIQPFFETFCRPEEHEQITTDAAAYNKMVEMMVVYSYT